MPTDGSVPNDDILDGGALLYRLPWKQGEIWQQCCKYVRSHYGKPKVVFDG
jgi:hypothetical protein